MADVAEVDGLGAADVAEVDGLGAAIFCRAFGACVVYFAYYTLPGYFQLIENTVLAFTYVPWHHLPLAPISLPLLEALRLAMVCSGLMLTVGILPRACLALAGGGTSYVLSLDRTIFNNHYVLLILLCGLLIGLDQRCVAWQPWARSAATTPALPRWQLTTLQVVLLTPYWYGAIAKLNPSWLMHAQPVLSWSDGMLGDLDAATHGLVGRLVDATLPPGADVLKPFAFAVSYAGLLFDLVAPTVLFVVSRASVAAPPAVLWVTLLACCLFHATNKIWFGLGVFPWLNVAALIVFVLPRGSQNVNLRPSRAEPRRWPKRVVQLLAVPYFLLPLRHVLWYRGEKSSLWTDEGHLYAWRMKSVEKVGWLVLAVSGCSVPPPADAAAEAFAVNIGSSGGDGENCRTDSAEAYAEGGSDGVRCEGGRRVAFRLHPEADTALHTNQAGELAHNPAMLLRYAEHLQSLLSMHGIHNATVRAVGSCVRANGFPAQPLYMPRVNLLDHFASYSSLGAELTGRSGVGSFLEPWRAGANVDPASDECDVSAAPEGLAQSDLAYRWLYSPLYSRPQKADWPWQGRRSRLPASVESAWPQPNFINLEGASATSHTSGRARSVPAWATRCSFLHALGGDGSVWCPEDMPQSLSDDS
jgi:vitamin K-dependent gamma-carboxylase